MKSNVNDSLLKYCSFDSSSYYSYTNVFGRFKCKKLLESKNTKGRFINTWIHWNIYVPYPNCPEPNYDTIIGRVIVRFDKNLKLQDEFYCKFIPDLNWVKKKYRFFNKKEAIQIAQIQHLQTGIEPLYGYFIFSEKYQTFIWQISNTLSKTVDSRGNSSGMCEVLDIDAITGKVLEHSTSYYHPVY